MNKTIWLSLDEGKIFPNKEEACKDYAQWCRDFNEPFDEKIFNDWYKEVTFEDYNRNYAE